MRKGLAYTISLSYFDTKPVSLSHLGYSTPKCNINEKTK